MDRLHALVSQVFDRNGDGKVGGDGELSSAQLATLTGTKVNAQIANGDLAVALRTQGGTTLSARASFITRALQSKDGRSMFLSGLDLAHMSRKLGLDTPDCRVLPATFTAGVTNFLRNGNAEPARFRSVYQMSGAHQVRDQYSLANTDEIHVTHVDANLTFDLEAQQVSGEVRYALKRLKPTTHVTLDTHSLQVNAGDVLIQNATGEKKPAQFQLGQHDDHLGAGLRVTIENDTSSVVVRYRTNSAKLQGEDVSTGKGLQWLAPAQTYSGKKPFFFIQGQPYNNRGLLPLQDTTLTKATYSGSIRVKSSAGLTVAVTSNAALGAGVPKPQVDGDYDVWPFTIDVPIQPYIFGVSVGELAIRRVGPRSVMYAEPHLIDRAARDYAGFDKSIQAAEKLFGPLPTKQLSAIMMPPSYPYGGMETFALNQVNSAEVTGTGENIDIMVHELAHSWFGNMVTNAQLDDFWLNEGFTTWAQRLILEEAFGTKIAEIDAVNGWSAIEGSLRKQAIGHRTCLGTKTELENPDHWITAMPYQKGSLFVKWLEVQVGRPAMLQFVRQMLTDYRFASLTTEGFIDYTLASPQFGGRITRGQLHEWIYGPGLPEDAVLPKAPSVHAVDAAIARWKAQGADALSESQTWSPHEWRRFLLGLQSAKALPAGVMEALDTQFQLGGHHNKYVVQSWIVLAIKQGYRPADAALKKFCDGSVGRISVLLPIFGSLKAAGRADEAETLYDALRPKLHPLAHNYIDPIIYKDSKQQM